MLKKRIIIAFSVALFLFASFASSGCSVYMATKQPGKKDVDLFKVGIPRNLLLAEFGNPMSSEVREDGKTYEIFKFVQGYSKGAKAGRAVLHGAADILTLGLWEAVGTPTEGAFAGKGMAVQVRYDNYKAIDQVVFLK